MGYTAIIATLAADHTTPPYAIYIDGTFVSTDKTLHRFGVDIDSIAVSEAGPGGISSMSFAIDDPTLALSFADSARVEYWDLRAPRPIFAGWIQAPTVISDFGEQGRRIEIIAYGIEAILDEIIIPTFITHPQDPVDSSGSSLTTLPYYIAALASFGPIRHGIGVATFSTQALPIGTGTLISYQWGLAALAANLPVDLSGMTIRQAIEQMAIDLVFGASTSLTATVFVTVDFYGGLRAFLWGGTFTASPGNVETPLDYASITVTDTNTAGIAAANLSYTKDLSPGVITNAVYVKGPNANATGWVVGDTTTGRHEQYATTAGTTVDDKLAAGQAILSNRGVGAGRGELDLLDFVPVNAHPGSIVTITDGPQGWAAKPFVITAISKSFRSNGNEDWHLSFQDPAASTSVAGPPSAAQLIRTLTRAQM